MGNSGGQWKGGFFARSNPFLTAFSCPKPSSDYKRWRKYIITFEISEEQLGESNLPEGKVSC
jgi:hypothetical protein